MQSDRQRIERAARENGWSQEDDGPFTTAFLKGSRAVNVLWDRDSRSYPVEASYGAKRMSSIRLTRNIIGNLEKA